MRRTTALALTLTLTCALAACNSAATSSPPAAPTPPVSNPPATATTGQAPPVAVSDDGRRLVTADGHAFPWVADTAWFLTQRLTREEIGHYLDTRVDQGFTTVLMVAVAARDGEFGETADRYGDLPYDGDFGALLTTDGDDPADEEAYDYWDHVEFAVRAAHDRGLTVALLPAWSRAHAGETLRAEHARDYGHRLAERLVDVPVIWVMGGDDVEPHPEVWRELVAGIREVDPDGLLTYHPAGWQSSLGRLDDADLVMVQTSHCEGVEDGYPTLVEETRRQSHDVPVVDAEPLYEDHPWCWDVEQGYSTPDQVRAHQWWSLFSGGLGVTYGHHSVWQFHDTDGRSAINAPRPTWQEALRAPAAEQMGHLRAFLDTLPSPAPTPDARVLPDPGQGWDHMVALRSDDGGYVAVYVPSSRAVDLDAARLRGETFDVTWFDPRTGRSVPGGRIGRDSVTGITPPEDTGDWVLTLRTS